MTYVLVCSEEFNSEGVCLGTLSSVESPKPIGSTFSFSDLKPDELSSFFGFGFAVFFVAMMTFAPLTLAVKSFKELFNEKN